jgi:hypothetical protein
LFVLTTLLISLVSAVTAAVCVLVERFVEIQGDLNLTSFLFHLLFFVPFLRLSPSFLTPAFISYSFVYYIDSRTTMKNVNCFVRAVTPGITLVSMENDLMEFR